MTPKARRVCDYEEECEGTIKNPQDTSSASHSLRITASETVAVKPVIGECSKASPYISTSSALTQQLGRSYKRAIRIYNFTILPPRLVCEGQNA